jgi:hypothetical protein
MKQDKLKKNLQSQAFRFFNAHYNGLGKNKTEETNKIRSHTTFYKHVECAAFAAEYLEVKRLKHMTPELAQKYLGLRRSDGICQKTLDFERKMLERIIKILSPDKSHHLIRETELNRTTKPKSESNRAYTKDQALMIMSRQKPYTQLSTEIAFNAGLRAFELLTIQSTKNASPASSRQWRLDLFKGLDGVPYIVKGKGGLVRTVLLSHELSQKLEDRRLEQPRIVDDRYAKKVTQHYDLSGGEKFSKSFSKASFKALGWSNGAHGARFSYAQDRMDTSISGVSYEDAKHIVSQELGHFRADITERYLAS